jgi:hypothetical protein
VPFGKKPLDVMRRYLTDRQKAAATQRKPSKPQKKRKRGE